MFLLDTVFSVEENKSVPVLFFVKSNWFKECYKRILV